MSLGDKLLPLASYCYISYCFSNYILIYTIFSHSYQALTIPHQVFVCLLLISQLETSGVLLRQAAWHCMPVESWKSCSLQMSTMLLSGCYNPIKCSTQPLMISFCFLPVSFSASFSSVLELLCSMIVDSLCYRCEHLS